LAVDNSQSMNVQSRAENNLKSLRRDLRNYSEVEGKMSADESNLRQLGQLRDLKSKVKQAEQQWQSQTAKKSKKKVAIVDSARGPSFGDNAGYATNFSNKNVQRELIEGNRGDFQADMGGQAESLPQINLQPALPGEPAKSEATAQQPGQDQGKPRAANRADLRKQAQSQSEQLNESLNAPAPDQAKVAGEPAQDQKRNLNRLSQEADADDILQLTVPLNAGGADSGRNAQVWPGQHSIVPNMAGNFPGGGSRGDKGFEFADGSVRFTQEQAAAPGSEGMAPGLPGWTTAGGLSLDMAVPQDGQKLTFSKSGGDARLALGLRPRAALETGFGLAWTVVWIVIGLGLIAALARADALAAVVRRLPPIATAVGLAWYFLLPLAGAGFALFVVGAICLGWQYRRA
jgi:hypothetical protein